jgi:glycosyltransferase involved in cell wall biosynthesis
MRVLFVSREYPPETGGGGIGSYVASMAPAIAALGHDVHVLSCDPAQNSSDVETDGIVIHRRATVGPRGLRRVLGKPAALRVEAAVSALLHYRRLGRFDVVEVPDWLGEGLLIAAMLDVPTVSHLHTPFRITREFVDGPWTMSERLADRLERWAVARTTSTTCPSQLLVDALHSRRWLDDRTVELIRYPVDWPRWSGVGDVAQSEPTVAIIGRVERRKGHGLLIEAMGRLDVADARLIVVGWAHDAGYADGLTRRADELGVSLEWTGAVDRDALPDLLSRVRVVAMPSEFESFGMVATEAMAAGRAVVVDAAVGAAELAGGLDVVPTRDPAAWAAALRTHLLDPDAARAAGASGRRTVQAECDPSTIAGARIDCYERAIAQNASRRRRALRPSDASAPLVRRCAPRWYEWAVAAASEVPWKHFYLATAEQLLGLLRHAHPDLERTGLAGVRICDLAATPPISAMLAELGAFVTQVDIERSELETARSILRELELPEGGLLCADAFRSALRSASFDVVWNSGFIEHFADPGAIVDDMAALARPGGTVCVLVPASFTLHTIVARPLARRGPGYYWDWVGKEGDFTARSLGALLRRSGLEVLEANRANVRRSLVDDRYVLRHERRRQLRPLIGAAVRASDRLERSFPAVRALGFMAGAIGRTAR